MRRYSGLRPEDGMVKGGLWVTTLGRTVADLVVTLRFDDRVCLLDSALHEGWSPDERLMSRRLYALLEPALALADGRAESALETIVRLLLVRAGIGPEHLQYKLFDESGWCFARLDLAWPSCKLAVEADGREHHDKPEALYRDRRRQNDIMLAGWNVLRFTWDDVLRRPAWVVAQVRAALAQGPKG